MNTVEHLQARIAADNSCPRVTLVTTADCHLCEDAHAELVDRVARGHLRLQVVGADSGTGQALLAEHRPGLFPLTLVDGAFFSAGRLPRRKLDRVLADRVRATRKGA